MLFSSSDTLPIHQTPNNLVLVLKKGPEEATTGATLTGSSKNRPPGNTGRGFSVSPRMPAKSPTFADGEGPSVPASPLLVTGSETGFSMSFL